MVVSLSECVSSERKEEFVQREQLQAIIQNRWIEPYFQPIVDLFSGEVFGYEVLSRAPEPFRNPAFMFEMARQWGMCWDLECVCRHRAMERIAQISDEVPDARFFLNVSPHIFNDSRFGKGFTISSLNALGIHQRRIVLEITETSQVEDYDYFKEMIQHYRSQGFDIALDDFGAGHSSLITLVAASPTYLKIDRELISDIHKRSYKQYLIKAIQGFSSNVDSMIIAEGIETEEELQTVVRLGIRYGQGYYLGRPGPDIKTVSPEMRGELRDLFDKYHSPLRARECVLERLMVPTPVFQTRSMCCEDLDQLFRENASLDHVVVLDDRYPVSLVDRASLYANTGGRFGYSLMSKRYIEEIGRPSPLVVNFHTDISSLGHMAMNRSREEIYDPVVLTDDQGHYVGIVTMKQLLTQFIGLEIKIAADANPLTNLPGNRIIEQWIQETVALPHFSVLYADLDRFKEYNDVYGFSLGDRMIRRTASILSDFVSSSPGNVQLGHIGGDDFVAIADSILSQERLESLCRTFDRAKADLFQAKHWEEGGYETTDRSGQQVQVPLVTLSLAVVTSENLAEHCPDKAEKIGQITASLKKVVKNQNAQTGKSGYCFERRFHG